MKKIKRGKTKNKKKNTVKKNIKIKKKIILIILLAILLAASLIFIIKMKNVNPSGKTIKETNVQVTPLNAQEINQVAETILSSEFIKDVPKNDPISLIFFKFENGQRIWQSSFLIGRNQLLTQGEPTVYLSLNSKYIPELNSQNLCEVIKRANENGDLGFQSDYSKARLLLKYASMLKHRGCFGF